MATLPLRTHDRSRIFATWIDRLLALLASASAEGNACSRPSGSPGGGDAGSSGASNGGSGSTSSGSRFGRPLERQQQLGSGEQLGLGELFEQRRIELGIRGGCQHARDGSCGSEVADVRRGQALLDQRHHDPERGDDGGTPTTVVTDTGLESDLTSDGTSLYFVVQTTSDMSIPGWEIDSTDMTGANRKTVVSGVELITHGSTSEIFVVAGNLYFLDFQCGGGLGTGGRGNGHAGGDGGIGVRAALGRRIGPLHADRIGQHRIHASDWRQHHLHDRHTTRLRSGPGRDGLGERHHGVLRRQSELIDHDPRPLQVHAARRGARWSRRGPWSARHRSSATRRACTSSCRTAGGTQGVYKVDPASGAQTLLYKNALYGAEFGVQALDATNVYFATVSASVYTLYSHPR